MNTEANQKRNYIPEYIVAAGYLLFFCLAFALCSTAYYFTYLQSRPSPIINTFATSLPPLTSTPHVLPTDQQEAYAVFRDDFSDDHNGWADIESDSKVEVSRAALRVESQAEGYYAYAACRNCPTLTNPFYLQADFSTSTATDKGFGIYFNYDYEKDTSFIFGINTEARKYYLYYEDGDDWSLRTVGESDQIKAFPAINTIGIYAQQDFVEFYVNGQIIDSYGQTGYSFHKGDFGFFVDDSDFQLIIDNLVISHLEK
jgi:hypothetical protein